MRYRYCFKFLFLTEIMFRKTLLQIAAVGLLWDSACADSIWYLCGDLKGKPRVVNSNIGLNEIFIYDVYGDKIIDAVQGNLVLGGYACFMHINPPGKPYTSGYAKDVLMKRIDRDNPRDSWFTGFGGEVYYNKGEVVERAWKFDASPFQRVFDRETEVKDNNAARFIEFIKT